MIWIFFINQKIYSQDDSNFPVTLSEDSVVGFEKNKTGFVVLTNQNLDFYSLSGLKLRSVGNTAISPSIDKTKSKRPAAIGSPSSNKITGTSLSRTEDCMSLQAWLSAMN